MLLDQDGIRPRSVTTHHVSSRRGRASSPSRPAAGAMVGPAIRDGGSTTARGRVRGRARCHRRTALNRVGLWSRLTPPARASARHSGHRKQWASSAPWRATGGPCWAHEREDRSLRLPGGLLEPIFLRPRTRWGRPGQPQLVRSFRATRDGSRCACLRNRRADARRHRRFS